MPSTTPRSPAGPYRRQEDSCSRTSLADVVLLEIRENQTAWVAVGVALGTAAAVGLMMLLYGVS
ncbi:MAG: hypothetical protein R3304_12005 [Longimicrobiales bacterium]|nr:hypothetical protein [Longimicrobiales bacterium]